MSLCVYFLMRDVNKPHDVIVYLIQRISLTNSKNKWLKIYYIKIIIHIAAGIETHKFQLKKPQMFYDISFDGLKE